MTAAAFTSQPDPPGVRAIPAALAPLFAAIEELDLRPLAQDDDTLAELLLGLGRATAKLDAVTVPVASAWDTRGAWGQDGSKSARARFTRESWASPSGCGRILKRARGLRSMPLVSAAFRSGRIGTDRVDALVRANAAHRGEQFAEGEAHLVSIAETVADYDDFARNVRYWSDAADDASKDGDPERRAKRQQETRGVDSASGLDGVRFLNGRFDAIGGDIVDGELRRLEQGLFEADWAEARARYGKDARADQLSRTARQRRADALVIMATRSKSLPDGAPLARPLISVLVDYPTLNGAVRELYNGTVLTAGQVASLLSTADLERFVFAGASRVLDVGARTRLFGGATRRAIEVRDRRCTFPGCTVPAEWCQVDHIVEWTDGGLTVQENGRLLCPRHNRQRPGRRPPGDGPPEARGEPADQADVSDQTGTADRAGTAGGMHSAGSTPSDTRVPGVPSAEPSAHGPSAAATPTVGPQTGGRPTGEEPPAREKPAGAEPPAPHGSSPPEDRRSGSDRRAHAPRGRPRGRRPDRPADLSWPGSGNEAWMPIRPNSLRPVWLRRVAEPEPVFTPIAWPADP